ncbi:MAG: hypothetical protein J6Z00_02590 [Clostridia bacterium]|nr:hypothetical protein [Clostridia bacterium]
MSFDNDNVLRKDNLNYYLIELSKEYKKIVRNHMPAEIVLVGGAAVIESYGFRDMTTDVDAIIHASSAMKEAIHRVADKHHLPSDWLNADFVKTSSYSDKLLLHSSFFKTFNQVLTVRVVSGEYLIAMKLRSHRQYKKDLSDIIGILHEHYKKGNPITFEQIDKAVTELYGSWDEFSQDAKDYIIKALSNEQYEKTYQDIRQAEQDIFEKLKEFEKTHPHVLKNDNLNTVIQNITKQKNRDDYER